VYVAGEPADRVQVIVTGAATRADMEALTLVLTATETSGVVPAVKRMLAEPATAPAQPGPTLTRNVRPSAWFEEVSTFAAGGVTPPP
jgi:hypothetical protein